MRLGAERRACMASVAYFDRLVIVLLVVTSAMELSLYGMHAQDGLRCENVGDFERYRQ
jgi:hypothetical protein